MNNPLFRYVILFFVLVTAQVFVFDKIQLNGYINPYIYVLFILMLPFDISGMMLLLSSFFLGLTIDLFGHTPGMHAAACTFMAFCRPGIIRLVGRREDVQPGDYPSIRETGIPWFVAYSGILVFLHHLLLFNIEVFRAGEFPTVLLKVLINSLLSAVLIIIIQFLFYSRKSD